MKRRIDSVVGAALWRLAGLAACREAQCIRLTKRECQDGKRLCRSVNFFRLTCSYHLAR